MNERDALIQVFRNRGWLSPALAIRLLDDARFRAAGELLRLERAGLLVRRQLPAGLMLFRSTTRQSIRVLKFEGLP